MKRISLDLTSIFGLTIIIIILTSVKPVDNFILEIFLFVMSFLISGYSLIAVLYPEENCAGLLRKPIILIELSIFLTVLISVILKYSSLGLDLRDLTLILSLVTAVLSITANILRFNHLKSELEETEKIIDTTTQELPSPTNRAVPKDLVIFTLLSLLMIVTVLVPPFNKTPIWMALGSLFICFIPGYLLLAVIFPKNHDLELVERFALASGASLILTPLIGIAFNYTPWSLRLELILIVLAIFSLIFCLVTFLIMKKLPLESRLRIPKMEKILTIFLIICILLTIGLAAYTHLTGPLQPDNNKTNSTDFYIKGLDANAGDNTLNLTSGTKNNLTMVLVNQEGSTVNYHVMVRVNNTILYDQNITLQNNQKTEIPLNFTAGTPGQKMMEFLLYKPPGENPYQKRDLWIKIS